MEDIITNRDVGILQKVGHRGVEVQMTSLELPDELYRKVKHRAVDEGTSFKAVVQRALEEYLSKKGGGKK